MNSILCSERKSPTGTYPMLERKERFPINHFNLHQQQKPKVPHKITASAAIDTNVVSENVCIDEVLEVQPQSQLNTIGLRNGLVGPDNCSSDSTTGSGANACQLNGSWIRQLRMASNVHFQNVSVEVAKGRKIRVRVVADVKVGDEIQMWFSPEVLIAMQIPFLTPSNIRDQNIYCCHVCGKVFEDPNPLKLHLGRHCDSLPMDVLWERLGNFLPPLPPASISTPPEIKSRPTSATHSPHSPATNNNRRSAFHPVNHQLHNHSHSHSHGHAPTAPFNYTDPNHLAASHLETIVSNMGTSKQGHLCIYCGKLYSRKYGLKIHIRTHTGFKPLKCKFCHRPFGDPSNLNKHIRLHLQNQSPTSVTGTGTEQTNFYKCHLCSKIMIRKRDLQRHIEMRHFHGHTHHRKNHHEENGGQGEADEGDQETMEVGGIGERFSSDSVSNISSTSVCSSSSNGDEDEEMDSEEEEPDVEVL